MIPKGILFQYIFFWKKLFLPGENISSVWKNHPLEETENPADNMSLHLTVFIRLILLVVIIA